MGNRGIAKAAAACALPAGAIVAVVVASVGATASGAAVDQAPSVAMPAPTPARTAALEAAAVAAAQRAVGSSAVTPTLLRPDTVEPINTEFSVPAVNGCGGATMFGNFLGAAYGKVAISSGSPCGISVYVVADQNGAVVDGPIESTSTSTWAQSTVYPATVIGEAVALCDSSGNCGDYDYTAF